VEHDNVNIITMGSWIVGHKTAEEIVTTYLQAQFDTSDDFVRRVGKLGDLERWAAQRVLEGAN
jgi:ribose 5-phosphate isomerase B